MSATSEGSELHGASAAVYRGHAEIARASNLAAVMNEGIADGLTSDPTAVSWASGRIDVFARGPDNALWHKWYEGSWSGWESLGGALSSGPDVCSWGANRLDVFARGLNNTLVHIAWDGARWSAWEQLGTEQIASDPSAVSWGPGRIDVFVRGTDNALYHKSYANGWSNYEQLGANPIASGPDASSWGPGRLDVFVRGTDNALYHKSYASGWSDYEQLGSNQFTGDPSAVSWGSGRIDVFVRGTDNGLYHKFYQNSWSDYESLGGALTSSPDASSWASGRLDVFVRGTDNALHTRGYQGGWAGWYPLGGPGMQVATSQPAPAASQPAAPKVVVRDVEQDFGGGKRGKVHAVVDASGSLSVTTQTWTNSPLQGFTMGVQILGADDVGSVAFAFAVGPYGVDGTSVPFGSASSRTDVFTRQLDAAQAAKVTKLVVFPYHAPQWRIAQIVSQTGGTIGSVIDAINDFCAKYPELCTMVKAFAMSQMGL